jgi:hypothetical protein
MAPADTRTHPFGPFAFNSGCDIVAVSREEWEELAGSDQSSVTSGSDQSEKPALAPTAQEINAAYDRLSPDLLAAFKESMAA